MNSAREMVREAEASIGRTWSFTLPDDATPADIIEKVDSIQYQLQLMRDGAELMKEEAK